LRQKLKQKNSLGFVGFSFFDTLKEVATGEPNRNEKRRLKNGPASRRRLPPLTD